MFYYSAEIVKICLAIIHYREINAQTADYSIFHLNSQLTDMLIYCSKKSPRLAYACSLLFQHLLSLDYTFTDDYLFYRAQSGPKIHYGERRLDDDDFFLAATPLLFEKGVHPLTPAVIQVDQRPALFPSAEDSDWPFDLLAMCFYCVTRYEEYVSAERDGYGRFPAQASLAQRYGFLQRPILNEWSYEFGKALQKKWPELGWEKAPYHFQLTYDIDMAWAYLHRPCWRLLAGGVAQVVRGQWGGLAERVQVLRGQAKDPFYVFDYLDQLHKKYQHETLYFWLLGDPAKYDLNADVQLPAFRALIRQIATQYPVGIHPSFLSNTRPEQIEREVNRLAEITESKITRSRQHFLMLQLPTTYRRLLALGITNDYSMGYADQVGYRAGIAGPFPWYDVLEDKVTPLTIHPFAAMDVTLNFYLKLPPAEALRQVKNMLDALQKCGGTFSLLWHNSSFAPQIGWKAWPRIFEAILAYAQAPRSVGTKPS